MKCNANGCNNEATKRAVFLIHSKSSKEPAKAETAIHACDECATEEEGNNLLVDNYAGRKQITKQFEKMGYEAPDWTRSKTEWVAI